MISASCGRQNAGSSTSTAATPSCPRTPSSDRARARPEERRRAGVGSGSPGRRRPAATPTSASAPAATTNGVALDQRGDELARRSGVRGDARRIAVVLDVLVPHPVESPRRGDDEPDRDGGAGGERDVAGRRRLSSSTPTGTAPGARAPSRTAPRPWSRPTSDRPRGRRSGPVARARARPPVVARASAGPSEVIGAVVQSTEPLVVTRPAASSAPPRLVMPATGGVRRHRHDHAPPRAGADAGCVGGAQPEEIGDEDQRQEQRALRREDVAEGQLAARMSSADDPNTPSS